MDAKSLPQKKFTLAMSVGENRHYKVADIKGRHFGQTAKEAVMGAQVVKDAFDEIVALAGSAPDRALAQMPEGFDERIHQSVGGAFAARIGQLGER